LGLALSSSESAGPGAGLVTIPDRGEFHDSFEAFAAMTPPARMMVEKTP